MANLNRTFNSSNNVILPSFFNTYFFHMLFACMDQAFDMIAVFKLFLYNYTTCHFFILSPLKILKHEINLFIYYTSITDY